MKKTTLTAVLLVLLAPMMSAWGNGTAYSRLFVKVPESQTAMGKVYASESSTVDESRFTKTDDNYRKSDPNKTVNLYAHAQANDGFEFVGWSETDGGKISSQNNPLEVGIPCGSNPDSGESHTDRTQYANFRLAEYAPFTIICKATANGTYNVMGKNGADTIEIASTSVSSSDFNSGAKTHVQRLTLTAAPNANCVFIGWYFIDVNNSKSYFSTDTSTEVSVSNDAIIGADFVSADAAVIMVGDNGYEEFENFGDAVSAVDAGCTIKVLKNTTIGKDTTLPYGVILEIGVGASLSISEGCTLFAGGSVVNNGIIAGSGTLALNYKTIVQDSTINVPFPYGTDGVETGTGYDKTDGTGDGTAGKYVKTRTEVANAAVPANCTVAKTQWFAIIVNGDGDTFMTEISSGKPVGILCKVNRKRALNWVTMVVDSYASVSTMEAALDVGSGSSKDIATFPESAGGDKGAASSSVKDNEYMVVLLEDCNNFFDSKTANIATGFAMDCAGNSFKIDKSGTSGIQAGGNYLFRFFNASSVTFKFKYILRPYMNFYGCPSVTVSSFRKDYPTSVSLYDSGMTSFNFSSSESGSTGARIKIYGGSKYSSSVIQSGLTKIYWGTFDANRTTYLADSNRYKMTQVNNNTWVVEKHSGNASHPFKVGTAEMDSLSDAIDQSKTTGDKIVLQKDFVLDEQVVVPADADVTLDLSGWNMSGNGSILNRGTLDIVDDSGSVIASILSVCVICEGGNAYLSGATFENMITAGSGKCWFLDGAFNGGITIVGTNAEVTDSAQIVSGSFASNVYMKDNKPHTLLDLCPGGRIVESTSTYRLATIPCAYLSGTSTYTVKAFNPNTNDGTLYSNSKSSTKKSAYSSRSEWIRAIELYAQAAAFWGWGIDCTLVFDRDVPASSITANSAGQTMALDYIVNANEVKSALLPKLREYSQSGSTPFGNFGPWTYGSFLPGGEHANQISMSVSSAVDENIGTSCSLQMRLASDIKWMSGKKDWSYDIANGSVVIASARFVFGAGDNIAMLQTAAGAVPDENFFKTLAAAVASDATTGKTIKLCNDCNEVLTVNKSCTIDPNGFEFSGTLTAGEGLSMNTENGVYVFKAPDSADVYVEQVKVDTVVSDDWKTENGLSENATEEEIHDALKAEDANKLPKWENLVIGQNPDEKAAVTAANGGTETTVDVAVTFEVPKDKTTGEKIETGYTVKYAFDKVDISTGDVVDNGEGAAQDKPTLDIKSVTAKDGPSYFKMRAVLEASDDSGVTAEVPVEKTIGVMKVESASEYTILAVPWKSLGTGDVKASELVHAASLQNGDELIVYGDDGKTFNKWTVKNGEWAKSTEYDLDDDEPQESETPDPGDVGLARGKGVWLKRSKPEESPIYLIGQPSDDAVETPLAVADDTEGSSWNLVASPSAEPVDVAALLGAKGDNADKEDRVVVPTGANSAPKNFHYRVRKGVGAWGYDSTEYVLDDNDNVLGVRAVFVTTGEGTTVPAGTGFWYLNSSKDANKTISWSGANQ